MGLRGAFQNATALRRAATLGAPFLFAYGANQRGLVLDL